MKPLITCVFITWLLSSCADKKELPQGIFSVNQMKMMVWDLEIADQQASERFILQKDSLRMEATSLYQQVFAKYKTNKTSFYKSFSFYESHPELLKILFDSVSNYGNRQKAASFKKAY